MVASMCITKVYVNVSRIIIKYLQYNFRSIKKISDGMSSLLHIVFYIIVVCAVKQNTCGFCCEGARAISAPARVQCW